MDKTIRAVIVGGGHRARNYTKEALAYSKNFQIAAVVDPDKRVLQLWKQEFGVRDEMCFTAIEQVLVLGRIGDCIINGTMDQLHVQTTVPFLKQGYDVLLEKPIATNPQELLELQAVAEEHNNKVMVCHVLRFSELYRKIKEVILSGEIGEIVHMETTERVGVAHNSISYIRGKWNNEDKCGSSMLLAKCSHDIDLLCWFNSGTEPVKVSSFGGRNFIIPQKAPPQAGTRCLVDCPLVDTCQYSAKLMLLESNNFRSCYPWQCTGKEWYEITEEEKIESLKTYNPHGVCAYKTDANVIDHQTVSIEFANGSTATHGVMCSAQRGGRSFYILGTHGEIEGWDGDGKISVRTFDCINHSNIDKGKERVIDLTQGEGSEPIGHFGGDKNLTRDFIDFLMYDKHSISCTTLRDSINGHLCIFAAEQSRKEDRNVYIDSLK